MYRCASSCAVETSCAMNGCCGIVAAISRSLITCSTCSSATTCALCIVLSASTRPLPRRTASLTWPRWPTPSVSPRIRSASSAEHMRQREGTHKVRSQPRKSCSPMRRPRRRDPGQPHSNASRTTSAPKPEVLAGPTINSTLVCIIGSLRGGPDAWISMRHHLLRPYRADLALVVAHDERIPSELQPHHIWRIPEAGTWDAIIDQLQRSRAWRERISLRENVWGGLLRANWTSSLTRRTRYGAPYAAVSGSGAIIFAIRAWLLRYLDALDGERYQTLITTRSDHLFACQHPPLHPPRGVIFSPEGESYDGVSDRHTIFAFADRRRVLAVLDWFIVHDRSKSMFKRPATSPEQVLATYYTSVGLRVGSIRRVMFVVRRREDATRWRYGIGTNLCVPNLFLKYEHELLLARQFCGNAPTDEVCPLYTPGLRSSAPAGPPAQPPPPPPPPPPRRLFPIPSGGSGGGAAAAHARSTPIPVRRGSQSALAKLFSWRT
eukprot:1458069-Prymnesium_polylepis.2